MNNKLDTALDFYNYIKNITINEQTKEKQTPNFSGPTKETQNQRYLEIYEFTGYTEYGLGPGLKEVAPEDKKITKYRGNIVSIQNNEIYSNVPIIGLGLGHLKGVYLTLKPNDLVLVGWLDKNSPVILGGVNDYYSMYQDSVPHLKEQEMLLTPKEAGSYLIIKSNDAIKLNNNITGKIEINNNGVLISLNTGGKFKLSNNGEFKFYNKDNYGIECDDIGKITIRGVEINHTQTPGTWVEE